jgi:hypothetical protein
MPQPTAFNLAISSMPESMPELRKGNEGRENMPADEAVAIFPPEQDGCWRKSF